jgi:hypothetical protein
LTQVITLGKNESELLLSLLFSAVFRTIVNGGCNIRKPRKIQF